jgi:2-keto-3-deoxy-6-phosphogluconate aldolase
MTVLKAAFMFLAPNANPSQDNAWVKTDKVQVKIVAVHNYQQACEVTCSLIEEGITAIELCGGFGNQGVAEVTKATKGKAVIGVVRFDTHPGLNHVSGDVLFG